MKFLCLTEFFHSGKRLYTAGTVYSDITPQVAEELIALDKKQPLGALSFFTPVDEAAVNFVKAKKGIDPAPAGGSKDIDPPPAPKKSELIAEAKSLGIKGTDHMNVEELKQVIEAAKIAQQNDQADPPPAPKE